jgi:hypothetical protein
MKILIQLFLSISILFIVTSCEKQRSFKFRYYGYIFNKVDSLPFANTQFKFYYKPNSVNTSGVNKYFYTDSNGFFDETYDELAGFPCWPAYHTGAAYLGPIKFNSKQNSTQDVENFIKTQNYDTIYTDKWY